MVDATEAQPGSDVRLSQITRPASFFYQGKQNTNFLKYLLCWYIHCTLPGELSGGFLIMSNLKDGFFKESL